MAGRNPPDNEKPDKGKGKSTDDGNSGPLHDAAAGGPSVFSRIAQSASGLSRDVLSSRPGSSDLDTISSASASAGKGSSSNRQYASSGGTVHDAGLSGSWLSSGPSGPSSGSFRSHAQEHAAEQERAFSGFLDDVDMSVSIPEHPLIGSDLTSAEEAWARAQAEQAKETLFFEQTPAQQPSHVASRQPAVSAVEVQQQRDGLDVVHLLSADGPAEEEPNYDDIELAEDEAEALKRALFGSNDTSDSREARPAQDWDSVLNFIPDFVRPNAADSYEDDRPLAKSHETHLAMGMRHTREATRAWLDQWHGVLTRYDDEVWGGLSPLVAQARDEVDALKETDEADEGPRDVPPASTKALERLRQILGHLRVD